MGDTLTFALRKAYCGWVALYSQLTKTENDSVNSLWEICSFMWLVHLGHTTYCRLTGLYTLTLLLDQRLSVLLGINRDGGLKAQPWDEKLSMLEVTRHPETVTRAKSCRYSMKVIKWCSRLCRVCHLGKSTWYSAMTVWMGQGCQPLSDFSQSKCHNTPREKPER